MENNKVVITTTSFAEYDQTPLTLLKERGFEVVINTLGRKLEKKETIELCSDCIGIIAGTEIYDRDILETIKEVKVISRCGVGIENIELDVAKKKGIKVFNTPYAPTAPVAELTVALILDLLRKVSLMSSELKAHIWKKQMGNLLQGKKVGIIGFGRIGQRVASLLIAFGCKLCFYDIVVNDFDSKLNKAGIKKLDMGDLLEQSDIVSFHVSGKYEKPLLGAEEIKKMKKGSWLINVARGGVVDEVALYEALKEGCLAGAALDVYEQEPYTGPLKSLDNVILTPHIGSYAKEARVEMEREAVDNLIKELINS